MNEAQRERLKEALLTLDGLSIKDREEWIVRRLADDPELQDEIRSLLAAGSTCDEKLLEGVIRPPATFTNRDLPQRIGPFVVEGLLGQGGMSNVYRAYEDVPVRRMVAVKVLRPGKTGAELLARFEAESEVIARLDHRNIARLIGVGTDDSGQPYFAMDLVDGPPITDYVKVHQLHLRQRLELFVETCQGVQHAHDRGILHRDIKPSNVLVAEEHGEPVARVIDFGVSRLLQPDSDVRRTTHGQIVGTLAYMSPEQADPLMPDADVRSDVYSLGVLLYELIAGRNPHSQSDFVGKSAAQIHNLLMTRKVDPPSLIAGTRARDIDCVALKAMEADSQNRYSSVRELAEDVERFIRGDGVKAKPPTRRQVIWRLVKRNRIVSLAIVIVVISVVVGIAGLAAGIRRSNIERVRATQAQITAQAERDRAERAAKVFDEVALAIRRLVLSPRLGVNAPYIEVLRKGAQDFASSPPESTPVRARVGFSLAQALHQAGDLVLAKQLLEVAVEDLKSSEFDRDNAPMRDSMLFTSYTMLAGIERNQGSDDRAAPLWEAAITLGRTLSGVSPNELLAASASLADVLAARGELEKSERVVLDAKAKAEAELANPRFMALLDGTLSGIYCRMQRMDDAVRIGNEAYHLRLTGRDNSRPFTIMLGLKYVRTLLDANMTEKALKVAIETQQLASEVLGPDHVNTLTAGLFRSLAESRLRPESRVAADQAKQIADGLIRKEGGMSGRSWRAQGVVIECLAACQQNVDATQLARDVLSTLIEKFGAESRDMAQVNWDIGRAIEGADPSVAVDLMSRAWRTYSRDLGERSLICKIIATKITSVHESLGNSQEAEMWRGKGRS